MDAVVPVGTLLVVVFAMAAGIVAASFVKAAGVVLALSVGWLIVTGLLGAPLAAELGHGLGVILALEVVGLLAHAITRFIARLRAR